MKFITFFLILLPLFINAQSPMPFIIGKVTAFNKYPISNAKVQIKDSEEVILTDSSGLFSFAYHYKTKITISANGFFSQKINIDSQSDTLFINLVLRNGRKNQEIATGYGHITQDQMSYAISNLPNENVKHEFYATIFDMIKSKASGVTVSGDQISIRGINTLGGAGKPLFVVDGFVVDYNVFKDLDPQSVKSISVLKDAAASARFGSRGMHGVIVVSMKRE